MHPQQSIQSHVSSVFGPAKAHVTETYGGRGSVARRESAAIERAATPALLNGTMQAQAQCQATQKHLLIGYIILLVGMAVLAMLASSIGCASTTLHTPIGDYTSTKDTQLDHLIITIEDTPDGGKKTHVEVNGAGGQASPVIAAQGQIIQAAIEAGFAAGSKAIVPIP